MNNHYEYENLEIDIFKTAWVVIKTVKITNQVLWDNKQNEGEYYYKSKHGYALFVWWKETCNLFWDKISENNGNNNKRQLQGRI